MADMEYSLNPPPLPKRGNYAEEEQAVRDLPPCFVRSLAQLAVYDPTRNATGPKLTVREAFRTFGRDKLEEAIEYGSAILLSSRHTAADALKKRRATLGLSHAEVARAAAASERDVRIAEEPLSEIPLRTLNRVALILGLDERYLSQRNSDSGDHELAVRLKTLQYRDTAVAISRRTALTLAEAASIIRIQNRLQDWLEIRRHPARFRTNDNYGSSESPAWKIGYNLAENTRQVLDLGENPIPSMRELVEERLGIPIIQAPIDENIAGATIVSTDGSRKEMRGIVLNVLGANENVWVRRATLAHELGHLLYDPSPRLEQLKIDSYEQGEIDPQTQDTDFVEQRANAFAIAFLAPNKAVRDMTPTPFSPESVATVMRNFGLSQTAASFHIYNSHYRQHDVPTVGIYDEKPSDEWNARENFALDYFPLEKTTDQRKGRFAYMVAKSYKTGLISEDTAALYLQCSISELKQGCGAILSLYEK